MNEGRIEMRYDEMVKEVKDRAEIEDSVEAERTIHVVLQGSCDRLTQYEYEDLLAQMPEPLKSLIVVSEAPAPITARVFVNWGERDRALARRGNGRRAGCFRRAPRGGDDGRVPRRAGPVAVRVCRARSRASRSVAVTE